MDLSDTKGSAPGPNPHVSGILVVGVAVLAYCTSLPGTFHYDDVPTILQNPSLTDVGNLPRFFVDPTLFSANPDNAMYRPVLLTTYLANHALGGLDPLVWHLTNVLLHALNAYLVMLLASGLLRVIRPGCSAGFAPLVAGLAFALHPVHTEVVNYVSSRSGAVATAGFLGALLLHIAWTRGGRGVPVRVILLLSSLAFFALGLGGKEIAVAFVPCVVALELLDPEAGTPGRRLGRAALRSVLPLAVAIGYLYLRKRLLGSVAEGVAVRVLQGPETVDLYSGGGRPLDLHLLTQARVFWMYLWILVVPVDLAVDRFVTVSTSIAEPAVIVSLAGIAVLLVVLVVLARRRPLIAFCGALFIFGLAPPTLVPLNVLMNEHRLYLPGVGFAILTGLVVGGALRRWPRATAALALAVMVCFLAIIVPRNLLWQDARALWEANVRSSPRSFRGHNQLGAAYKGEAELIGVRPEAVPLLDRAIDEFSIAARLYPDWYHAHLNLGFSYLEKGRILEREADFESAIRHFERCRELTSADWRARYAIATTYGLWKRYDEAIGMFSAMAEEDREPGEPRKTIYLFPMAKLSAEREDLVRAEELYREVLATLAEDPDAHEGLAAVLLMDERTEEARALMGGLVGRNPGGIPVRLACARFLLQLDPPDRRAAAAQFQMAMQLGHQPSPEEFDRFLGN
jgi:tetratricopeptide (TPR) repeat protein